MVVVTIVALNLFVGVILSGFAQAHESNSLIKSADFEAFQALWLNYDPAGSGFIPTPNLMDLVQHFEEPWGFGADVVANHGQLRRRVWALNIPVYRISGSQVAHQNATTVFYYDVLLAFVEMSAEKVGLLWVCVFVRWYNISALTSLFIVQKITEATDFVAGYLGANTEAAALIRVAKQAAVAVQHAHDEVIYMAFCKIKSNQVLV